MRAPRPTTPPEPWAPVCSRPDACGLEEIVKRGRDLSVRKLVRKSLFAARYCWLTIKSSFVGSLNVVVVAVADGRPPALAFSAGILMRIVGQCRRASGRLTVLRDENKQAQIVSWLLGQIEAQKARDLIIHHRLCNPARQFMRTENSHNTSQARAAAASGGLHQHKNGGRIHLSGLTAVPEPDLMGQRLPVIWRASRDTQFHGVPSPGELCVTLSSHEDVKQNHTHVSRTTSSMTGEAHIPTGAWERCAVLL